MNTEFYQVMILFAVIILIKLCVLISYKNQFYFFTTPRERAIFLLDFNKNKTKNRFFIASGN